MIIGMATVTTYIVLRQLTQSMVYMMRKIVCSVMAIPIMYTRPAAACAGKVKDWTPLGIAMIFWET